MSNRYTNKIKKTLKSSIKRIKDADRKLCVRKFDFKEYEIWFYHLDKSFLKRFTFVPFNECNRIFSKYNKKILDKKESYKLLNQFYKHDCLLIEAEDSYEKNKAAVLSFAKKHNAFVVKTFGGVAGHGIKIIEPQSGASWVDEFLKSYPDGCLIEEVIKQSSDLSNINPWSVNTLRITTVNCGGHIKAIYPVMRFGTGHEKIDNSESGILCAVDRKSGNIVTSTNIWGEEFKVHPDTKAPIIGFHVPELETAISKAKELAAHFPDNVFTGFDFAHTEKGWILVEANTKTNFAFWQGPYKKGFKKELKKIDGELL